ncbi:FecR domain-containing protein [Aeoliella sp. SH292]|uniref:FecR domain-containing protein n=1 Tax=Aeoliella sp. SH292 TaxID=3454464 RepID=UPI003F9B5E3A
MEAEERDFVRLTRLVIDDLATDDQRAELARLSQTHPELVSSVVDLLTIDALLKWRSGDITAGQSTTPVATPAPVGHQQRDRRLKSRLWTAVLAATVLIAAGVGVWTALPHRSNDLLLADIVDARRVVWEDSTTALSTREGVRPGRLSSSSGEYTLQFRDGASLRVVGRASLDIKSKMLVRLDHGQATARVPHESRGFTIESNTVDVIDRGPEFGMAVDGDNVDVVVFDGEVDIKSNLDQAAGGKRLTQGEAIQIDGQGAIDRLMDIYRDTEGRWWKGESPSDSGHVIARVTDNIGGSSEVYSCYQTTYKGMQDDVLAYSDNPHHQWNSLTAEGLPDFLRGADYIRSFNHYRYMQYFEMTVELSTPANLYVFSDNRIPPPDWLVEQFEDTGVDIGLDEGPWEDEIPAEYRKLDINTTDKGPGKSIDNVFSVWRRRCTDTTPITLGSAGTWTGNEGHGRAMYGVAATPLEVEAPEKSERPSRIDI